MGVVCSACYEIHEIPKRPKYFFTKFDAFVGNNHQVKLEPRLLNIKGNPSIQIKLKIFTNSEQTAYKQGGTTDEGIVDQKTGIMTFQKFFFMEYFFEKPQPIEFIIFGDIEKKIQTSLPTIMGSRGQTYHKEIDDQYGAILEIKGFSYKQKIINILKFNIAMKGNLKRKGLTYEIIAKNNNNKEQPLYISEGIKDIENKNKIEFISCSIPDIHICDNSNYNENELIILFKDAMHKKALGKFEGPLSDLVNKETIIHLKQNISAIIKLNAIKNYSFIDYLRGGMEINLTVAIDFTGSNGDPEHKDSYHFLGAKKTVYEEAIKACGDIVGHYDNDQKFPAFGFGGKFNGNSKVSHCFPLNGNPNDPEIETIDGILKAYREVLNNSKLYGPTYFHYIIDNLNETVKKETEGNNYKIYNILMILTDGIIDDMDETINSLVEASYLPISVIIIGIGDADFTNMNRLDADEEILCDESGRIAERDLVQFVPFKDFKNDGEKLAEQVLEEIPRQIVEFFSNKNIPPGKSIPGINF